MTADAYGMLATIAYSLAAVFAVIAIVIFFTQHIRKVHDDLTGRTEQRAIADLRSGSVSRARFFVGAGEGGTSTASATGAARRSRRRDGAQAGTSSGLKLRRFSRDEGTAQKAATGTAAATGAASTGTAGTTAATAASGGVTAGTAVDAAESGTTLISPFVPAASTGDASTLGIDSEAGTTLLGGAASVKMSQDERTGAMDAGSDDSEAGTTLLDGAAETGPAGSGADGQDVCPADDSEAGTTLLGS